MDSSAQQLVTELLDRYTANGYLPGPGLIRRLDDPNLRTTQPRSEGRAPLGPRLPAPIDAVSWSLTIKAEAVRWDMELRRSTRHQTWERALRAIPPNADHVDRVGETLDLLGRWHSTALTCLGLRELSVKMPYVVCFVCGEHTIMYRADHDRPRAWCTNPECRDEDGRPARYRDGRMWLLVAQT